MYLVVLNININEPAPQSIYTYYLLVEQWRSKVWGAVERELKSGADTRRVHGPSGTPWDPSASIHIIY